MNKKFTPFLFQYTHFAGRENSLLTNLGFAYELWLSNKIESLIEKTPDLPERIIKKILQKVETC